MVIQHIYQIKKETHSQLEDLSLSDRLLRNIPLGLNTITVTKRKSQGSRWH